MAREILVLVGQVEQTEATEHLIHIQGRRLRMLAVVDQGAILVLVLLAVMAGLVVVVMGRDRQSAAMELQIQVVVAAVGHLMGVGKAAVTVGQA